MSGPKIIVSGILFWYPLAGVTLQFLHYLLGLRRLGYDPYYIEDSGRWIYDPQKNDLSPEAEPNIGQVVPSLERHGFGDRWAFRGRYPGGRTYGLAGEAIDRLYREAAAFLNVTGAQEMHPEHLEIKRRIYVESDPFALQVKADLGDASTLSTLAAHDTLFTFGENLGAPDCQAPTGQLRWLPTRQPVALDLWSGEAAAGEPGATAAQPAAYNTITTWHNKGKDIEWRGQTWYWTKDREFTRYLDLPRRQSRVQFELAATVDPQTGDMLRGRGWRLADSVTVSRTVEAYQKYIRSSRAEFTVARDQYVRPRTGWFSDRSACYLAAGRPVITQETGFSKFLPTGKGLFAFSRMEDILAAVDEIERDYEGNRRAARDIAGEFFRAEKVLGSLMRRAGI